MINSEDIKLQFQEIKNRYRVYFDLTEKQIARLSKEMIQEEKLLFAASIYNQSVFSESYLILSNQNFYIFKNSHLVKKFSNNLPLEHQETEGLIDGKLLINQYTLKLYNSDIQKIKSLLPNTTSFKKHTFKKEEKIEPNYFLRFGLFFFFIAFLFYIFKGPYYGVNFINRRFIVFMFWSFFFGVMGFQLILVGIIRKDK